jgi:hypothetical protein
MHHPRDILPIGVGFLTAGVGGGLTLSQIQGIVGVIAGVLGIVLTVATFYWRYREYRCRMRKRK